MTKSERMGCEVGRFLLPFASSYPFALRAFVVRRFRTALLSPTFSFLSAGSPSLQSTVQVTIDIVDVNDNAPIITPSSYVAGVMENLPSGQSVLRVGTLICRWKYCINLSYHTFMKPDSIK